jgi:hypothetical protein
LSRVFTNIATCLTEPDGDWYESNHAFTLTDEQITSILPKTTRESLTAAITIITATKVNFWLMNHHVGQTGDRNVAAGYVQKALTTRFGSPLPANVVHVAHMLGHYASTRFVLERANIPSILPTEPRAVEAEFELRFADDAQLRFSAPPAGTHRMNVCFEVARRLSRYSFAHFCPQVSDFSVLPAWREQVMANPATYHVGALYLTGTKNTAYSDSIFDNFIGRLGTFIQVISGKSTLANSPHFAPAKVESAPDYDPTWRNILMQVNRAREAVHFHRSGIGRLSWVQASHLHCQCSGSVSMRLLQL